MVIINILTIIVITVMKISYHNIDNESNKNTLLVKAIVIMIIITVMI